MSTPERQNRSRPHIKLFEGIEWLYFGSGARAYKLESNWFLPHGVPVYSNENARTEPDLEALIRQIRRVENKLNKKRKMETHTHISQSLELVSCVTYQSLSNADNANARMSNAHERMSEVALAMSPGRQIARDNHHHEEEAENIVPTPPPTSVQQLQVSQEQIRLFFSRCLTQASETSRTELESFSLRECLQEEYDDTKALISNELESTFWLGLFDLM
eukprot:scaffold6550_cov167-Amphora_coffeaeformis.AAC.9